MNSVIITIKSISNVPFSVPRETLDEMDKIPVGENSPKKSGIMGTSKTCQISTDCSETTLKTIKVEIDDDITNKSSNNSGEKAGAIKSEKESEEGREGFSKTTSEEIKNEVSEKCLTTKEEVEEPTKLTTKKTSKETPESCRSTRQADGTATEKEGAASEDALNMHTENERKRPRNMSEKSQDRCSDEHVEREACQKKPRLFSKQDASCEESQKKSSWEVKAEDKAESCKLSQIDEGM